MTTQKRDNQHYTPQLLLRGFTITGKSKMTFRYKKGTPTSEKSIRKIASKNNFYKTEDGDNSVDDAMSDYENSELKCIIEELRNNAVIGSLSVERSRVEQAVLHLWARSRNFRDALSTPMDAFLDQCLEVFGSEKGLKNLLTGRVSKHVEDELCSKFIECMPMAASMPKPIILKILNGLFAKNPEIFRQMAAPAQKELGAAKQTIQPSVKSEHIGFMSKNSEMPLDRFKGFSWFLWEDNERRIAFPDCVLLAYDEDEGFRPIILADTDNYVVALPISTSRLLVGTPSVSCPDIKDEHLKRIGRCAFDFFIHPVNNHHFDAEKEIIGDFYSEFSDDVVDSALSQYWSTMT